MTRVFYVEDEPFLAKIVKESLATRGYVVSHFVDGMAAKSSFTKGEYDICVLDIMLPKFNGYEIAEYIRKIDIDIPIIFLTAKSETKDLLKGFETGGNDYVKKPFSMEELIVRIENLIKMKNSVQAKPKDQITLGKTFIYFPNNYSLVYRGDEIKLSYKEVLILNILCKNINKVSHRKAILMEAWGDDSYFNSRNLDVYIRKLRGYFSIDESIEIITLKGVGYQFKVD